MLQVRYLPTLPSLLEHKNTALIHRDLSWLQFNERVLAEARQPTNPLLERVKFLAISASNLDEFFMIRVASLNRAISTEARQRFSQAERLQQFFRIRQSIQENVAKFCAKQMEVYDLLIPELTSSGIEIFNPYKNSEEHQRIGHEIFKNKILPLLPAPEAFNAKNLNTLNNLQLAAIFPEFWVRIPKTLPLFFNHVENHASHVFFLDELLISFLPHTLGSTTTPALIRVTRDCDYQLEFSDGDSESIPDLVKSRLRKRDEGRAVRVQYSGNATNELLDSVQNIFRLSAGSIFPASYSLCLGGLWTAVRTLPEPSPSNVRFAYTPPVPYRLELDKIFERLKHRDYLLHHPYDSFDTYIKFIENACLDPNVTKIEQTIYRMDALSPVVEMLKAAAATKKIRIFIELRARFDELNNLRLAEDLRSAGVDVEFGFGRLKLHAKITLVTRKEGDTEWLYTHLSTGNYNATTARQYTDLGILTSNPTIGNDAKLFFETVARREIPLKFKQLVLAPTKLHRRLISLIDAETEAAQSGRSARIFAKVNALVDEVVIEKLYSASQAGVQVDLVVRGACSLVPGIPRLSKNIRVISIVDRYLEHSRIYHFHDSRKLYLSSADWMPRNFFSRLEIAFPVLDPKIYEYIEHVVIPTYMADTAKAKELTPQGTWKKRALFKPGPMVRSQAVFEELAHKNYRGTPLE